MSSLLIDIGAMSCGCSDYTLEVLHKAVADPPDDSIWRPHENPYIRDLVESFTRQFVDSSNLIYTALMDLLDGKYPWDIFVKSWTDADFTSAKAKLDKPFAEWTVDDWFLAVDWLFERYVDPALLAEAEVLAVKSLVAGKLQLLERTSDIGLLAILLGAVPDTINGAFAVKLFKPNQLARVEVAKARAGEFITAVTESTRHAIRMAVIEYEELRVSGASVSPLTLKATLFDRFAVLNRDFRRIAITEAGRNANEAVIDGLKIGSRVRRVEAYPSACPFCKKLHAMEFDIVAADDPNRDGWKHIWPGKNNIGRSSSPRKRVGDVLVERDASELWWPAAGVQHPHCRGQWVPLVETPNADPDFMAWVDAELAKVKP